jgi:hypothetical protein
MSKTVNWLPSGRTNQITMEATVDTFLAGRHQLGTKIVYVSGTPLDPENKGCRIWYRVPAFTFQLS